MTPSLSEHEPNCLYLRQQSSQEPIPTVTSKGAGRNYDTQCTSKTRACEFCYQTLRQAWSRVTRDRNMRSRYRCSMCPAIHINSRSWLRSSSTCEPSDPPLRVCQIFSPLTVQRQNQAAPMGAPLIKGTTVVVWVQKNKTYG